MTARDHRNSPLTGAGPGALAHFERALASFQCWRADTTTHLDAAIDEAPGFTMAYVLRCWLALCSREPGGALDAAPSHATALALGPNERERAHLAAIGATMADDYARAREILDTLLDRDPHDVLALQVAHAFDYLGGETAVMHARVARVAARWTEAMPGYHAVLAMLAFAQEESGAYERAEQTALRALALNPFDARAHHALAHVYEMTGRPDAGVRLMGDRMAFWAAGTTVATHCWWHLALFHLEQGRTPHVLALYDRRVRGCMRGASASGRPTAVSDLIDASALLWRLALRGVDVGATTPRRSKGWGACPRLRRASAAAMRSATSFI
jgi:tetratricopeptide (TPR) repeat protein